LHALTCHAKLIKIEIWIALTHNRLDHAMLHVINT